MRKHFTIAFATATALCCLSSPLSAGEISLFVAASLREVMNELSDAYATAHPGVTFRKNYGASGTLAKQIENGAPADIFLSANTEWLEYLKRRQLVDEHSSAIFAYNVLVFVGKPELKAGSLADVARLDKIAIGSPMSVPAGAYALEALRKAGIDRQLAKKLVMARDVRECLMYADRGEVDGSFVYRTDAIHAAKNVRILFTVPQELYPRVTYPLALTAAGTKKGDAVAFLGLLRSETAKHVLKKHGFIVK